MTIPIFAAAFALAEFAPSIVKWLGGEQAKDIAHEVVEMAKRMTGTTNNLDALQFLKDHPLLVADFQRAIIQMEADWDLNLIRDRQDARARDVALYQQNGRNTRADIMVIAAAIGLALCLGSLAYYSGELPGEAVGIISTIAGIFGSCLKDAYAFEFGSSRGSKEKDWAMATMLEKKG